MIKAYFDIRRFAMMTAALAPFAAYAGSEGMPSMPMAQEKAATKVVGNENFEATTGFGPQATQVNMMSLMMVGGSGSEGMDMSAMQEPHKPAPTTDPQPHSSPFVLRATILPSPPQIGANQLDFYLVETQTRKPAAALKLRAEVFMTTMNMGSEEATVKEMEPGHYRLSVSFAMSGPWAVRVRASPTGDADGSGAWQNVVNFDVGGSKPLDK